MADALIVSAVRTPVGKAPNGIAARRRVPTSSPPSSCAKR